MKARWTSILEDLAAIGIVCGIGITLLMAWTILALIIFGILRHGGII